MNEVWKSIPGTADQYAASSLGRIKSLYRIGAGKQRVYRERILRHSVSKSGYCVVGLSSKIDGRKSNNYRLHRLVCMAFHPNHGNKPEVNHKDCNKLNNRADNLEWVTALENTHHAQAAGRVKIAGPIRYKDQYWIRKKIIINTETGERFVGIEDLAAKTGFSRKHWYKRLAGERPNYSSFQYTGEVSMISVSRPYPRKKPFALD